MKNDPCSAKHRMPFLQIFADQLSQTAASLPGANVKHPSSAAVWAYAHLDKKFLDPEKNNFLILDFRCIIYRYVHPSDDRRFGGWGWSGRLHKHTSESDANRNNSVLGHGLCAKPRPAIESDKTDIVKHVKLILSHFGEQQLKAKICSINSECGCQSCFRMRLTRATHAFCTSEHRMVRKV